MCGDGKQGGSALVPAKDRSQNRLIARLSSFDFLMSLMLDVLSALFEGLCNVAGGQKRIKPCLGPSEAQCSSHEIVLV